MLDSLRNSVQTLLPISRIIISEDGLVEIEGNLPQDVILKVEEIDPNIIQDDIINEYDIHELYKFELYRNGEIYIPINEIKVKINSTKDYLQKDPKVISYNNEKETKFIEFKYDGKSFDFKTDTLSSYGIITRKESTEEILPKPIEPENEDSLPNTGDNSKIMLYQMLFILSGVAFIFALKNIRNQDDKK